MSVSETTIDPRVVALAEEIGWSGGLDEEGVEALTCLLDDEYEKLDVNARKLLAEQLAGSEAVLACPDCGNLVLARYQSDDVRCRVCAAPLVGQAADEARRKLAEQAASEDWGYTARVLDGASNEAAWIVTTKLTLGKPVVLDKENEDWDDLLGEIVARREAEERSRREAEEAERRRIAEEEARRKAAEEAKRKAAEEAKRKAAEEAERKRRAAEEAKRQAEEEARRQAEEEARRQAEEELARKQRAEQEARRKAEEAARRKAEEDAERERIAAEQAAQRAAEDAAKQAAAEMRRPTLGGLMGERTGEIIRIEDMDGRPPLRPGEPSVVWMDTQGIPRLEIAPGSNERVNGRKSEGSVALKVGDMLSLGKDIFIVDEKNSLEDVSAPQMHFARNDDKPGGPWPYYDDEVQVGAALDCQINLVDDGVADHHAKVYTQFGRVILQDVSRADGLWVRGRRMKWLILRPDLTFQLGKEGPELQVKAGFTELKSTGKAARAMKPTRHNRTMLEVYDEKDQLVRRVFLFTRREIRFGRLSRDASTGKLINELPLIPAEAEAANISPAQGGFSLTRGGVDLQRWRNGEAEMLIDDEVLEKGRAESLRRRFSMQIGEGMLFEGRVYRSPVAEENEGPARLGMGGGHPFECVRLERIYTNHTYVYLVRMMRMGSQKNAPLLLDFPGVHENHAIVQLRQGRYQIVAPRGDVTVELPSGEEVQLEAGRPAALQLNTKLHVGQATLAFRVVGDADFEFED